VNGAKKVEEASDHLVLTGETDRVYLNVPGDVQITDTKKGTFRLKRNSFPECVIWNLWAEKAKVMADMGDDDWKEYVCAESATIEHPVVLNSGHQWIGRQEISKL